MRKSRLYARIAGKEYLWWVNDEGQLHLGSDPMANWLAWDRQVRAIARELHEAAHGMPAQQPDGSYRFHRAMFEQDHPMRGYSEEEILGLVKAITVEPPRWRPAIKSRYDTQIHQYMEGRGEDRSSFRGFIASLPEMTVEGPLPADWALPW